MKRKILVMAIVISAFVFAGCRLTKNSNTWLRIEESGICYELDYLHRLADRRPRQAMEYLGRSVSFAAPLYSVERNVKLQNFGELEKVMSFALSGGRWFIVDCAGIEDTQMYSKGEILKVKGRITAVGRDCICILNIYGTPGFPNNISVEKAK